MSRLKIAWTVALLALTVCFVPLVSADAPTDAEPESPELTQTEVEITPPGQIQLVIPLPPPDLCYPDTFCETQVDCGWDPDTGCFLGECHNNSCICY